MEENRVLREQLASKRLRLTDNQRRRLAVKAKALGRKLLGQVATIVTPLILLAWHRKLVAMKWTFASGNPGRPRKPEELQDLVVRLAKENPRWGYERIQGAMSNLGYEACSTTVASILKENGITPAPERGRTTSWRTFLKAHWEGICACDFYSTEVWTPKGLVTFYTFFVIELATRRVDIIGTTPSPDGILMAEVAKAMTDPVDGIMVDKRFPHPRQRCQIHHGFADILEDEGVETIRIPYGAPNANAFAKRFVKTIKEECLSRLIFFGADALMRAQRTFL